MSRPVTPVAILAARLEQVAARLARLPGVEDADPGLAGEAHDLWRLAAGLDDYVARSTTAESPALAALARRTAQEDWSGDGSVALEAEMLSGHVEGQLLQALVHATGARTVLEIGMFTGYSALAMAEALPAGGRVVACELDPRAADLARECFAASSSGDRIEVELGPALETLERLEAAGERFDLVFVDADKAGYRAYLDALLDSALLAPGALVCVDNTLMQGEPWTTGDGERSVNGQAIADFNATVAADDRVVQVLLPVRDGVTLLRRAPGQEPEQP